MRAVICEGRSQAVDATSSDLDDFRGGVDETRETVRTYCGAEG